MITLHKDEQMIWTGCPGKSSLSTAKQAGAVVVGLSLLCVALTPKWIPASDFAKVIPADMMILISSAADIIIISGLGFLLLPFIIKKILSTTEYVVTNERIVVKAFQHASSYMYKDLYHVDMNAQTGGRCDLVLYSEKNVTDIDTAARSNAYKILFIPQDVAEYVRTQVDSRSQS